MLTHKTEPNFFIIIKYDKIPDQKIIEFCHKLYQEHLQAKNLAKNIEISIIYEPRRTRYATEC